MTACSYGNEDLALSECFLNLRHVHGHFTKPNDVWTHSSLTLVTSEKVFRVAQKGEVNQALTQLNLKPSFVYSRGELASLGKSLNSQAVLTGKITDLGTNIDVHMTLTDVATGEVISSATENLNRTKFAVEMLRHH